MSWVDSQNQKKKNAIQNVTFYQTNWQRLKSCKQKKEIGISLLVGIILYFWHLCIKYLWIPCSPITSISHIVISYNNWKNMYSKNCGTNNNIKMYSTIRAWLNKFYYTQTRHFKSLHNITYCIIPVFKNNIHTKIYLHRKKSRTIHL